MSEPRAEYLGLTGYGYESLAQDYALDIRMDGNSSKISVAFNSWYERELKTTAGAPVPFSITLRYRDWRLFVNLVREALPRVTARYRGNRAQNLAENRLGRIYRSTDWDIRLVIGALTVHLGDHAPAFCKTILRADQRIEKRSRPR